MKPIKAKGDKITIASLEKLMQEANEVGQYRIARRLHAVILNSDGWTNPQIARILRIHRSNVVNWINSWNSYGVEGLLEGHRSGRPPLLTQDEKETLGEILDSGPVAYGFTGGVWTSPMIARVISEEFNVYYHPGHVRKLLKKIGFSVQRPRKKLALADLELQSKWRRYTYPNIKKKLKKKTD